MRSNRGHDWRPQTGVQKAAGNRSDDFEGACIVTLTRYPVAVLMSCEPCPLRA